MRLKRPDRFTNWEFFLGENDDYRIPLHDYAKNKNHLISLVISTADSLQQQGAGDYLDKLKQEADSYKMELNHYVSLLVEHQICVRATDAGKSALCWASGIGDKIHSVISKIESKALSVLPKKASKVYNAAMAHILPGSGGKASGCRRCGGTSSFSTSQKNNAGRVNKLN
jgi:hypothetical protein